MNIKMENSKVLLDNLLPWQRSSPISIIFHTLLSIKRMSQGAIYILPALAISFDQLMNNIGSWLPIAIGLFMLFPISGTITYWFYQFRVTDNHVEVRSGVLQKRHSNIPFYRIQNVKLEQPFYYQFTGHQVVTLDTAGSQKEETKIVAIKHQVALAIKEQILNRKLNVKEHQSDLPSSTDSVNEEVLLNSRSLKDLVIHGLTNNRVWLVLGALAPFFQQIVNWFQATLVSIGFDIGDYLTRGNLAIVKIGFLAIAMTLMLLFALALLSVAGSVFAFYKYRLVKQHERYIRRCGLFTKREVSLKLSRLQVIRTKQDWLDVILKRVNFIYMQNVTGRQIQNAQMAIESSSSLIVPSITQDEVKPLAIDAWPDNCLHSCSFTPIHFHYFWHLILVRIVPVFSLLMICAFLLQNVKAISVVCLLLLVAIGMCYIRWRRYGIAWDSKYVYVRKGLLGVDHYCFPRFKLQQITLLQSIFMAKRHLISLHFVLASGPIKLPFIPKYLAYEIANDTLYKAQSSSESWM